MQHIKPISQNHRGIQLSAISRQQASRAQLAPTEEESGFGDPSYSYRKTIYPYVSPLFRLLSASNYAKMHIA